jgi:capsule polysaccharide export protein KpsC/LpsZ
MPQLHLKFEPFANLESLFQNILFQIRKNYISTDQLVNEAYQQYILWTNLAAEEVSSIVTKSVPETILKITLDVNGPALTKAYNKMVKWNEDPLFDFFKKNRSRLVKVCSNLRNIRFSTDRTWLQRKKRQCLLAYHN